MHLLKRYDHVKAGVATNLCIFSLEIMSAIILLRTGHLDALTSRTVTKH